MKSTLLKSITTAVIISTTMALTSVITMAATGTDYSKVSSKAIVWDFSGYSTASVEKKSTNESETITGKINGAGSKYANPDYESTSTMLKLGKGDPGSKMNATNTVDITSGDYISIPVSKNDTVYAYVVANGNNNEGTVGLYKGKTHASDNLARKNYAGTVVTEICAKADYTGNMYIISEKGEDYILNEKTNSMVLLAVVKVPEAASTKSSITSENAPEGDEYAVDALNSYIIHTVTAVEMEYNELALANSTNEVVNSTKTVYSTITFPDGSSITAPEGTYLYAVKVDKTTEPTNVNYSWIEKTN